jgi:hypothetical protein
MPSFTPLNTSDSYLVKKLDIHDINNKIIKDTFKDALLFTNPLKPLPKK